MKTNYLRCEHCEMILLGNVVNTPEMVPCPACRKPLLARVFPAFFRSPDTLESRQEAVGSDEEASCFFHPTKKAVVPCANCGRFLCALCDLEFEGSHLCPTCVENNRSKPGATGTVLNRVHVRYDSQALMLAALPVFWFFAPITASMALYYALRYWNLPRQALIPRGHARQIIAIVLAVIQLVFWIGWCASLFLRHTS